MWKLVVAVPLALSLVNPTFAVAQEAPAPQKSLPEQIVDAFNAVFGVHPGARSNHAKGVILEGTFTPSATAASVSKAAHLQKQKSPIPVMVRFSAGSGLPTVPDTAEMPRGMAVKFTLADASSLNSCSKWPRRATRSPTPRLRGPTAGRRSNWERSRSPKRRQRVTLQTNCFSCRERWFPALRRLIR